MRLELAGQMSRPRPETSFISIYSEQVNNHLIESGEYIHPEPDIAGTKNTSTAAKNSPEQISTFK